MTPEQIIEIAHRYSDKAYPAPDDSSRVTYWEFLEKDLIDFAQSVIEAERDAHGITVPIAVWDKLKGVNTVKDLLIAMKAAEEGE